MAEKRTIDINIKNNADEATKDFNTFNDALDQTAKSAKNVNSTFEEVYGDLQPLTTRLGEAEDRLYELALAGETTSKEYQELLTKVGEYRKVQIETDLAVDAAATTLGQKLGGALTGATSGFATVQGVMGLVGSESQVLEKALLKVQSALAIQQGVQGIRESIPAFKQFGMVAVNAFKGMTKGAKLFAATGLGLVITGIATAIALFDDIDESEEDLEEARKQREQEEKARHEAYLSRQQAKINAIQRESEAEIAALDRERRLALSQGKSVAQFEKAILQERLDAIQKTGEEYVAENEKIKESVKKLNEERRTYVKSLPYESEQEAKASRQYIAYIDRELAAYKKRNKQIIDLVKVEKEKREEAITEIAIYDADILKQRNEKYKQWAKERLDIARLIEDLENDILEDGLEKELEINRDRFRRLREDVKGNAKEQARLRELYTEQEAKAEAEIRNKFRNEELQKEIDFFTENKLPVLQAIADEEVKVEINKWSLIGQAQAEAYKKEEALRKRNQDFAVQTTLDGLSLISDITELFGKKGEKQAKKAFQVQKAAQIAAATIETYRSAQSAYLSQFLPVPDPSSPVRGGIAAGVAVAAGLTNIAKIASQQFEGGGSTGGGSDFSGGGVGGGEVAPQFNVVGDSGINQLAQLQQQPTQAYVVSGEVTSAQALDRNRVTNATL